ncbi:hypothetical protein F220043C3_09900 [Enterocloster asparagiformis]
MAQNPLLKIHPDSLPPILPVRYRAAAVHCLKGGQAAGVGRYNKNNTDARERQRTFPPEFWQNRVLAPYIKALPPKITMKSPEYF